jgi:hypothetical protein
MQTYPLPLRENEGSISAALEREIEGLTRSARTCTVSMSNCSVAAAASVSSSLMRLLRISVSSWLRLPLARETLRSSSCTYVCAEGETRSNSKIRKNQKYQKPTKSINHARVIVSEYASRLDERSRHWSLRCPNRDRMREMIRKRETQR